LPTVILSLSSIIRGRLLGRWLGGAIDALPLISGAFGTFDKEAVIAVGRLPTRFGYEDMNLCCECTVILVAARQTVSNHVRGRPGLLDRRPLLKVSGGSVRWSRGLMESIAQPRTFFFIRKAVCWAGFASVYFRFLKAGGRVIEVFG